MNALKIHNMACLIKKVLFSILAIPNKIQAAQEIDIRQTSSWVHYNQN